MPERILKHSITVTLFFAKELKKYFRPYTNLISVIAPEFKSLILPKSHINLEGRVECDYGKSDVLY